MYALLSIMQAALAITVITLTTRAFAHKTANVRIAADNKFSTQNPAQPKQHGDRRFNEIWHSKALAVEYKM